MPEFASLVLLTFKRPDNTEKTLNSLLSAKTDTPWELIVVDDGSRDPNWPHLIQRLRLRDLSTLVLNAGSNLGVGVGMNRGFSIARGQYVVKLDADLEFKDYWLDDGIRILKTFPQCATVGFFDYHNYTPSDTRFNKLEELFDGEAPAKPIGWRVDDYVGSAFMLRRADWLRFGVMMDEQDGASAQMPRWRGFEEGSAAFAEDIEWKNRMTALGFFHAITHDDTIANYGFGLGKSTVVVADEQGEAKVQKIATEPVLLGGLHNVR